MVSRINQYKDTGGLADGFASDICEIADDKTFISMREREDGGFEIETGSPETCRGWKTVISKEEATRFALFLRKSFFTNHTPTPAVLVRWTILGAYSPSSVMVCTNLPDLDQRLDRYRDGWMKMFPETKSMTYTKELLEDAP